LAVPSADVEFDGEAVRLSGTIAWPEGAMRCPGVVLVGGSGASDRHNGGLFDALAQRLVETGVAVLRYDKRGVGRSSGEWPAATVDDLAGDAAAALATLRSSPLVAEDRIGVFGHSEGGWVALRLAVRYPHPDYLILNGCSAVSFVESEVYALAQAGIEEAAVRPVMQSLIELVLSGGGPEQGRRILSTFTDEPWYEAVADFMLDDATWAQLGAWCTYDPIADLERLGSPTLVLLGGKDVVVPVQASVQHFEATAIRTGRSQCIRVFADADHRLQSDTVFAADYLATISRWCRGEATAD
jgi:pimeloyl-ACP methyl ester carboxylesterase